MRWILFLILSGCSYRWQPEFPESGRPTITVPFAAGDEDGAFTNEIVYAISASGLADVRRSQGDYRLQVAIVDTRFDTIGYRRDRQKITGEIKKNLVATEGRKSVVVEATLYEGDSDRIAFGPYRISSFSDYDYVDGDSFQDLTFVDPSGALVTVLPFSLGQLEPGEAAQEAATRPLYAHLAKKIVDALSSQW